MNKRFPRGSKASTIPNMDLLGLIFLSVVANGMAHRLDADTVYCPLTCTPDADNSGYVVGKVYTYQYAAMTTSRVSGTADQQTSNSGFSARVSLEKLAKCHYLVNVETVQSETMSQAGIETLRTSLTQYPLHLSWQGGKVEEVCAHESESKETLNIKRGFLSAMQNTFNGNKPQKYENDVTGNCYTSYSMESGPGAANTVKKTKDLNKCTGERTRFQTSMLFTKYQADSTRKSLLKSTQGCNQTWSEGGVMARAHCVEKHVFRPFSYRSKGAETVISQNLEMLSVGDADENTQQLTESKMRRTTLSFEEIQTRNTVGEDTENLITALEEMCDLTQPKSPSGMMPGAFLKIVAAMKGLSWTGLRSVWDNIESQQICSSQPNKIRQTFMDSLSMCEKDDCVKLAVQLITSNSVDQKQKAAWIGSLSFVPKATESIIKSVRSLISGTEPMTESYLTLGSLLYRFCQDTKKCETNSVVLSALDTLQEPLGVNCHTGNSATTRKILLSLRALGNAGISSAIQTINSCISESRNTPEVRLAAMSAFRRMWCSEDRTAVKEVFANMEEDSEIRIAAYSALARCPSPDFVRSLMSLMQTEEVNQVGSYIWNHVMEVKDSSDPLKGYMRALFRSGSLPEKFSKDKRKYSSFYEKSIFSETLNLGAAMDGDLIWSTKSFIPRSARINMTVDLFGSAFNILEIGGRIQGAERALERILGPTAQDNAFLATILGGSKDDIIVREKRDAVDKYDGKLEAIQAKQPDLAKEEDPSASVFMRVFGNEMSFNTFGKEIKQQADAASWFGGLRTLFNLVAGSEYSMQHSRILADSVVVIPTAAGFPLELKVSGASTMDVSMGGQIDLKRILFEGFHIGGYVKPRATVEVHASMTTTTGPITRSGIDLESTLATSIDVNGTMSLTEGRNFRLKVDVPQEQIDVFNFRSRLFTVHDDERTAIVPVVPENQASWCTEAGSQLLGLQVCMQSSKPHYSTSAEDETPLFPLSGPAQYSFEIRKTDPMLSHYLLETSFDVQSTSDSTVPDELTARFYVGTPGSQVDRSREMNLQFTSSNDDFNFRISTAERSVQIQANKQLSDYRKQAEVIVTLNEMTAYRADASLQYTSSRTGGHVWSGNAHLITPGLEKAPPTVTGSFAYTVGKQMEGRLEITNVMSEAIIVQGDAEKTVNSERVSYVGNARVEMPTCGNVEAQVRSSTRDGRDRTHLTINYELFGVEQQSITLLHKSGGSSTAEQDEWSVVTDVALSQFPSLNHKIQLKHEKSATESYSSFILDYGQNYEQKANIRRFAVKQTLTNQTDETKTHLGGRWSMSAPEYGVDYGATLRHVFDWSTTENKIAVLGGSFSQSEDSNPLTFDLRASDKSTQKKMNIECEATISTPWGDISALQRLIQVQPGLLMSFGNFGFGQAAGLQMQMVSNITTMDQRRGFSMHLYRPQPSEIFRERTLDDDSSIVQPLPSEQDIALFSSEWTTDTDWVLQGDYMISGLTVFESQWNNRFEMSSSISQDTTSVPQGVSGILVNKRFNFTMTHPSKMLQLSGVMQSERSSTNNEFQDVQNCRRNASVRLEWTDSSANRKFVEGRSQFNLVTPKTGKWNTAENRFDVSFSYELNDDNLQRYIPVDITAHARVYARPSVDQPSFSTDHIFGLDLGLTGSNLSPKYAMQLTKEFRVGFSDLKNFILSMSASGRLPSSLNFVGNFPREFGTSGEVSMKNGFSRANFMLSNNDVEMMSLNMTLNLQENNRFVGQGHWKQRYFPEMLPNLSVNVESSVGENQVNLQTTFVLGQNQEQRFNASVTYNRSQMQLLVVLEHNLSYLSQSIIPSRAQFMVRLSSTGETETRITVEASSDSSVLASARFVITTPTAAVDPYTLRVVVQQNTSAFLPSLTEAVFTCYWNPQTKYGLGVRINSDAQEGEANAIIDLGNVQKIILNHNQGLSSLAWSPERSNIVLELSDRGLEMRYSVDSTKLKLRFSAETLHEENDAIRTNLNLLITHNSQSLTETWHFPKRVSMSIEMEGSPNVNLDRISSTLSVNAEFAEKSVSSAISVIRFNDNGELNRVEMSLTGNHNLEAFVQIGLPTEFGLLGNVRKINSGYTIRLERSYGDQRNYVEITMYARDIVNRDMPGYKVAAEVNHNYDYLTSQFGLPLRTAGSIQIEELDCCVGFWLHGEFEFGTAHTLSATMSLNCNDTATTFTGHSEVSPRLASMTGLPQVLDTRIVGYVITEDKIAGLKGRISVDDEPNNFAMYISVPETDNRMDSYELSIKHTFETLKIAYSIPLNATVTITGKITPWSYAKGNMEFRADESYNFFRFNTGYRFNPKTREYKFDYSMRYNIDMISSADNDTQAPVTKVSFGLKMNQGYFVWWDFALFQERFKGKMALNYSPIVVGFTYSVRHTFATLESFGFPKNIEIGASVMMGSNNTFGTSLNIDFWRREMGFLATLAYTPGDETEVLEIKFETRHNFKKSNLPKKIGSRLTLKRQGSNQLKLSLNSNVDQDKTRVDLSFRMEPESYQNQCSYVILLSRDPVDFSLFEGFELTQIPISIQLSFEQPRERKRLESNARLVYPGNRELLISIGAGQSMIKEQGVDVALEMTNNVPFIRDSGIPDGVHGTANFRVETGKTERFVQAVSFRTSSGKHIDADFNVRKHTHDRYEASFISSQNINFLVETFGYPEEFQTSARITILDDQLSTRIRLSVDQRSHYIQMTMHFPTEPDVPGQYQLTRSVQLSQDLPFFLNQLLIPRESEVILNIFRRHDPNVAAWFVTPQEVRASVTINVEQSAVVETSFTANSQSENCEGTFTLQHNSQRFSEMGLPRSNRVNVQLQMASDNHMIEVEWTQNAITRRVVMRTTNQIIAADSKRAQREASLSFNHDIDALSDAIPTSVKLTVRRLLRTVHPTFRVGATLWVGHNQIDFTSELSEVVKVGAIGGYALRFGLNQDFSTLIGYGFPRISDLIVSAQPASRGVMGGTVQVTLSRDEGDVNTISVILKQHLDGFEFSIRQDFPELSDYSVPQNVEGTVAYRQGVNSHNLTTELCYNANCVAVTPSYSVDKNTKNILVAAEMTHNFEQLTNINIPSIIKVEVSCNLTPNSASIGFSSLIDRKEMEFNSGFNISILTGEWSSRSTFSHTWDVLESQYDIPRQMRTSLAVTRVQERQVDVAGDIQIGSQTANCRVVLTGTNDSGYGDFSYYESHNFRVLRDLLIPNHLRLAGSLHKSLNGFQAGWEIKVNQFAVNTSMSGTKSSSGYYDITFENAHNFNQDPIADQLSINLRAGSSESSGFIGEVRSQVGRKKNTASISTRSTGKQNSNSFRATLRQDMTSDLDETSVWYQLASSVEVVLTANINTDTAAVSARCSIDEHSLELSYQHSRQSVSSWGVIGSVTQSLPKLKSLWPDLPQRITFSGDMALITDGYQTDVDLQYDGITESVQLQGTYRYNKDTRRNELKIIGSHDVDRWFDQYGLAKQIQLTLFHDYQMTAGDLNIAAGYLIQLDKKQVHMSFQMSLQNSIISGSDRQSFQAYVDCGHGTTWLQELGLPQSVRFSFGVTPKENGMDFELRRSLEEVQKFISGSISVLSNSQGKPAVEFTLNHNLDMLREMYFIPLSSRLNIFFQTNSVLSQVDTGLTLIGDERSFVSSISYKLLETSFNAKFAEEITNWPCLSSYLLSSIDAAVDIKVEGSLMRLTYEQTINTELERFETTCGYVSQSTDQTQQELTITMQHTFVTLSAYDIPTDVRVVFGYQTADGRHTVSTDLTLGAQYARVTVYVQQEQSSVRVSFESEQSVLVHFGVSETIRTSGNVRWTQNSCSLALEYSTKPAKNNRLDVTLTWNPDQSNIRNEVQMQFSQNVEKLLSCGIPNESTFVVFYGKPKKNYYSFGYELELDERSARTTFTAKVRPSKFTLTVRGRQDFNFLSSQFNLPRVGKFEYNAITEEQLRTWSLNAHSTIDGKNRNVFYVICSLPKIKATDFHLQINTSQSALVFFSNTVYMELKRSSDGWKNGLMSVRVDSDETSFSATSEMRLNASTTYSSKFVMQHNVDILAQYVIPTFYQSNMEIDLVSSSPFINFTAISQPSQSAESTTTSLLVDYSLNATTRVVRANVVNEYNYYGLPTAMEGEIYLQQESNIYGTAGLKILVNGPFEAGIQWDILMDNNSLVGASIHLNALNNIEKVQAYGIPSELNVQLKYKDDSCYFNASMTQWGQKVKFLRLSANAQEDVQLNGRSQITINLQHNIQGLENACISNVNRLCLHYINNAEGTSLGFKSNFDEKFINASVGYLRGLKSILSAQCHHNMESLMKGGIMTASFEKGVSGVNLSASLTQDDTAQTPMEVSLRGNMESLIQGKYDITVIAEHNLLSLKIPSPMQLQGSFNNAEWGNVTISGAVYLDNVEEVYFGMEWSASETFGVLTSQFISRHAFDTNVIPANIQLKFNINAENYENTVFATGRTVIDGIEKAFNARSIYSIGLPITNISASMEQDLSVNVPKTASILFGVQLPSSHDAAIGVTSNLTTADGSWNLSVFLDTNIYFVGSPASPLGKAEVSFVLRNNVLESIPNQVKMNMHFTRIGKLNFNTALDLDVDNGTKMFAVSVSNAQDSESPETVQALFSITHNFDSIPDVPQSLHLQASGKRTDNGFMFSILRTINDEPLKIGELNLRKATNSATGRKDYFVSFQHSTQLLSDLYVPETLELNAYKEPNEGNTIYSYNLSAGGKSNSCTLTITPTSFDLLSEHDWVTLTLITGLPYTSHISAEWTGESFPFQKVKLSYLGDLQMLETTIGLTNSYEFSAVLNHNMRTWQILGLPMHNQGTLQLTITENMIRVEGSFGINDRLFTTVLTLTNEVSQTRDFMLDFSTKHNMTLTYPLSTLLRGKLSLTPDSMVNMFITLTLDENVAVELRQSGSINYKHWPRLFNTNVTIDFTNSLPMFTEAGIPENVHVVATMQLDESDFGGNVDVSLNGRNLFVVNFGKQEDSALALSVNIGQAYIINLKEGERNNKTGINFELEFGDTDDSDLSVFAFRADPQAILDFVIELDAPSFFPEDYATSPIFIAFQVDEDESGLISARFEANLANENFKLCLSDIAYIYLEAGKWSLTYDLTIRHNVTLLTDKFDFATNYVINDRLYYGIKPNIPLEVSSSMKSGSSEKGTVIFKVEKDSVTPLSYKILASIKQNTSLLKELLPQSANLRLVNVLQNDDVFGKKLSMKATYQADDNQFVNIDITGGVGKFGTTIQGELTHQNTQWLAERLPTNDDLNRIKGKFEFVDLTAGYDSSIIMQKSLELETVYGTRNGSAKITAERRRTDNEFSTGTLTANLDHQMPELRDAGVSNKIDFSVSSVAYADSFKYDSIATWSGLDSVVRKINATMQYDGGFPSRMYGSHTFFVELFHPFELILPSPVRLTGSAELLDSRINNDWRIKYDGKDQFVTQQRMETTKPKSFEADFILIQPMEEYPLKTLDLTTSVNTQGKTTNFLTRAVVNNKEPASVSGTLKSLNNELVQRKGYEVNFQYQSGILGQIFKILQQNVEVEISVEKSLNSARGSFNLTCAERTLAGTAYARMDTNGISTLEMNVEQPFEVLFINGWAISRGAQLVMTIDRRNENQVISDIYLDCDTNPNRISLKTTLSKHYRDIVYGFESILKRSTDAAEDWVAILNIRNNSFAEHTNFTGEASIQCLSEDFLFKVVPSYGATRNLRNIGLVVQHGVLREQEWNAKWSDDLELNRVEVSVQTPYNKVIRNVFEKKPTSYGTQYSSIMDWSDVFQTEHYVLFNSETIVLTSGFKTDKESGYVSAQGKCTTDLLMFRLFQKDSTGPQFPKEDDLIQIRLSVPVQGWMQFKMRSQREELSKTILNVANLESGVRDFTRVLQNCTLAGQISQFDIVDEWQATAFDWLKNKLRAIQQTTMQSSTFGSEGQLRTVIEQLGLPLSQLRRAYYDSFVQQLKEDSEEIFESIFETKGQTKIGWLTVKYAKEILNHKIDTLDEQLYAMIAGSLSPESSLIHLSDQQIIVNFPTVYSTNSLNVFPVANVIRDWLAGTVVTQVIRQALGYGMADKYYRFLANWNSEQAPPFPGFATVINGKQIVTFDGKLYDVEGLNCAHVLAHDFLDQNFTLIMQRTPESGSSFLLKTKDENKEQKTLQIQSTSMVSINSQPVHLPYDDTTFSVRRSHTGIEIKANKRDVNLKCSYVSGFVCQLELGAFYHGRVSGLMGTMDNEPENDITTAEGLSDDDVIAQQDSWAVSSNTSTITCQSTSMSPSSCMEDSDICTTLFDYSKSELRSCFPVVDPQPYLEACRRQLCNEQMACGLATAYRTKCKKFGASTNMPQRCVSCEDNALHPSSEELASGGLDTVIVMEGGKCLNNLRGTLPRLLRLLGSSQDNLRFGLVVYGTKGADLYTVTANGNLMGTAHNLEKVIKHLPVASPAENNIGTKALDAVKLAALFPFRSTSNRNVVMMTCSDCGESNQVKASEMNDLLNRRGISFHLIRGQGVTTQASRSGKKLSSKSRIIGYERSGAFTKQSIRGNQPNTVAELLNQIIPSATDVCTTALSSINDYSVWNASEMATQVKRAGKDVTGAIANRMTIATASTSTCNCRCEILSQEGVFRSVCGTC